MSPEKQQIAIAEACGWTASPNLGSLGGWIAKNPKGSHGYDAIRYSREEALICSCPDYLNDLNAMHEAEEIACAQDIQDMRVGRYQHNLILACGVPFPFHATAAQRAEAFLKTIGKWEDGK